MRQPRPKDTDWFMHLSKNRREGGDISLVHGVIRARYRASFSKPELVKPGKVLEYHLDLWHTGITIPAGQKLRVEVASAAFPMFSRNLNTGGTMRPKRSYKTAKQTIHHSAEYPSQYTIAVIPSAEVHPNSRPGNGIGNIANFCKARTGNESGR